MDWSENRGRLAIIAVAAVVLVIYAVRDAQMASVSFDPGDLRFVLAIYGIPFLVFVFMIWTGRWAELRDRSAGRTVRQQIALAAEVSGVIASGMFLLSLPLWMLLASHESFGVAWVFTGVLVTIAAIGCALVGSPRLWRHAIAAGLLLPFWIMNLALLAKAVMD